MAGKVVMRMELSQAKPAGIDSASTLRPLSPTQMAAPAGGSAAEIRPQAVAGENCPASGAAARTGDPPQTKLICLTTAYGDTLWGIARLFGTTVSSIAAMNDIADPDRIFPGQRLYLRVPATTPIAACTHYAVRPGDTLWGIARRFGLDTAELARWNNLFDPDVIYPGQALRLDGPPAAAQA